MKDFSVVSHFGDDNKILEKNTNGACFAGVRIAYGNKKHTHLYIADFREKETEKYIPILIKTINDITQCELVKIEEKEYIKFKLLGIYDKDLVVLNFIRNLWCSQRVATSEYKYGQECKYVTTEYNVKFFEYLAKSRYKDPFKKLTSSNIKSLTDIGCKSSPGHSNIHNPGKLVVRDLNYLMKNAFQSTLFYLS